jgi:hypothetical protein
MLGKITVFNIVRRHLSVSPTMLPSFALKKWNTLKIADLYLMSGISVTNSPQTNAEVTIVYKNLCELLTKHNPEFSPATRELGKFGQEYHIEKHNLLKIYESYWRCKINDKLDEIANMNFITDEKERVAINAFKHVFRNLLQ